MQIPEVKFKEIGEVTPSGTAIMECLKNPNLVDMFNTHVPELLQIADYEVPRAVIGMGEFTVEEPLGFVSIVESLLQGHPEWLFAPPSLFLCGTETEDGGWVLPKLGSIVVLHTPKIFRGGQIFYPRLHEIHGVKAFGLAPWKELKGTIRFPVIATKG
ncbi:MAG: hypothetical protein FJY98_02480 [Candidatus Liptonbacteria bacterium]|nr:hypothetical protein [Candidatus Liptonbacteria bacterium]